MRIMAVDLDILSRRALCSPLGYLDQPRHSGNGVSFLCPVYPPPSVFAPVMHMGSLWNSMSGV